MTNEAIEHAVACMRGDPKALAEHARREADIGWYYLHENGELIYRRTYPEIEVGGFVKHVWPIDRTDRKHAWTLLLEAAHYDARTDRIIELAEKWGCDLADLGEYLTRETSPTPKLMDGLRKFATAVLGLDIDKVFDFAESNNRWPTHEDLKP